MAEFQIIININIPDTHTKEEQKRLLGEAQDGAVNGIGHQMAREENQKVWWQYNLQMRTPPGSSYQWTDVTIDEAFPDE